MSTIVVGIDGSPGSVAALEYALEEARLRNADLKVVAAWYIPGMALEAASLGGGIDPRVFEEVAASAVARVLAEVDTSGVALTRVVREGNPSDVLLLESRDADCLVVGSRGLGGFRGLLLGSVSQQCSSHAKCPVTVVPHPSAGASG